MSILVEQPHRRVRPLSGLGAYASMLPRINQYGAEAMYAQPPAPSRAQRTQAARYKAQQIAMSHRAMRGLGDGEAGAMAFNAVLRRPTPTSSVSSAQSQMSPGSLQAMQQQVSQTASSQLISTPGTWDGTDSPSPVSLTIEGALPSGIAFLLAGALGLLGASMIFGGK